MGLNKLLEIKEGSNIELKIIRLMICVKLWVVKEKITLQTMQNVVILIQN